MPSRKGLPKPDRAAAPSNSSPEAATAALRRHYLRFQRAEDTAHLFFSAACGYYVAARFAAFAHLNPVAGNLFHHAIEMYLKGGLSKTKSIRKLEKFKHSIQRTNKRHRAKSIRRHDRRPASL
jgi:hypothetical protein